MSIYSDLGLKPVINANATLTKLGGSRMPPEVVEAMRQASRHFVDLHALQQTVSAEIARLTRNEACYVCCGAASGIVLAIAACLTRGDPAQMDQLPASKVARRKVIVHRLQRNQYDYAVRQAFAEFTEVGHGTQTLDRELEAALDTGAAALIWFEGSLSETSTLSLQEVISRCQARGVPVIVDAAAQLPPVTNLWTLTAMGADMVIFSGGKDLRGPQSSGLLLGKKEWIDACHAIGAPHAGLGRPMKVGKEEMLGLLAAVRRYVSLDQEARRREDEAVVAQWCETLNRRFGDLRARRSFPNEAGQPLPRMEVDFAQSTRWTRDTVITALLAGEPAISVAPGEGNSIFVNPMTLEPEERSWIIQRLVEVLQALQAK